MTDKKTYVILPNNGEIEFNYLVEQIEWARQDNYELRNWFPRKALIEKNGGGSRLFTGQTFDDKLFELKEDGWTHDHCEICFETLSDHNEKEGFFNGQVWICKSCHDLFIEPEDINEPLNRLEKIEK